MLIVYLFGVFIVPFLLLLGTFNVLAWRRQYGTLDLSLVVLGFLLPFICVVAGLAAVGFVNYLSVGIFLVRNPVGALIVAFALNFILKKKIFSNEPDRASGKKYVRVLLGIGTVMIALIIYGSGGFGFTEWRAQSEGDRVAAKLKEFGAEQGYYPDSADPSIVGSPLWFSKKIMYEKIGNECELKYWQTGYENVRSCRRTCSNPEWICTGHI
ncbi:MAG: hypothetical protein ABL958_19770 [Bdellovibrionia bacterium]